MARNKIIYIDMDGVLADFDKRVKELTGRLFAEHESSSEAWKQLMVHEDLYLNLDKMPDADQLVAGVMGLAAKYGYRVGVLTALPKNAKIPLAEVHKRIWIALRYPDLLNNFRIGPLSEDKHKHCTCGDILIDDWAANIIDWNNKEGLGILHVNAAGSLARLEALIKKEVYYKPSLAVDVIITRPGPKVLLIKRKDSNKWAFPGGFLDHGESLEEAAIREVKEECGLDIILMRQQYTYSKPGRDPRFPVVSTVFVGMPSSAEAVAKAGDDAKDVMWVDPYTEIHSKTTEFAFDHREILEDYSRFESGWKVDPEKKR